MDETPPYTGQERRRAPEPPTADAPPLVIADDVPHFSPADVARMWRISEKTVLRRIKSGKLVAHPITPRNLRVSRQAMRDFEALVAAEAQAQAQAHRAPLDGASR